MNHELGVKTVYNLEPAQKFYTFLAKKLKQIM